MEKSLVTIFTDGAAKGNPGPGGYGTIIQYVDKNGKLHEKELSSGFAETTNNRMELMAAIVGLEALNRPCTVMLYSDSKYLIDAFNQKWIENWEKHGWKRSGNKEVLNPDLWQRLLEAAKPHEITWNWVKGHNGHPENERCDKLASDCAENAGKDA